MNAGVVYLLTGAAHAARLVVSLASLRRWHQGPVAVHTTREDSHAIGARCAVDARLGVQHRTFAESDAGKSSSYLTKIELLRQSPFEFTLLLDCDTLIAGDIGPLLEPTAGEFVATRFADWTTATPLIRKRLEPWRGVRSTRFHTAALVDLALETARPSINTGVVAARRDAPLLRLWRDLALDGRKMFICDESALHLLLPHFSHRLLDCRWNNSPTHGVCQDVRIWHFHGDKHAKEAGLCFGSLEYQRCVRENFAGLAEWGPGSDGLLAGTPAAGRRLSPRTVPSLRRLPWSQKELRPTTI